MEPLLIIGAVALAGVLVNATRQPTVETYEDPFQADDEDFHAETQAPPPEATTKLISFADAKVISPAKVVF